LTMCNSIFSDVYPIIAAEMVPIKITFAEIEVGSMDELNPSISAPRIAGIDKRNE